MSGMLKRACCLTVLMFVAALLCLHSSGRAKVHSGKWGSNTTWYYDTKTKTVTIACQGKMYEKQSGMGCQGGGWLKWSEEAKRVVFKPGITYITSFSFEGFRELEEVVLPEGLVSIGYDAFYDCCRLKKIECPSTLREIYDRAFSYAGVESVSLRNVEMIGSEAFSTTKLKHLNVTKSCKIIKEYAFDFCTKLKSVTIENGVRTIGTAMFLRSGLQSVTIPASVTEIKKHAFFAFSPEEGKLKNVTIKSTQIKKWGKDIFGKARKDLVIRVPKSKKREYTKALRESGLPGYVKILGE